MKIAKIIYYIIIGFLGLIALLLIISVLPISGNFKVMTVLSGSMEPEIKTGSIIVVKPTDEYRIGDIITFNSTKRNTPPITHRIIEMKVIEGAPVYITKGDTNNAPDTREIKDIDIVGKVLLDIPYMGFVVDFARKPLGFMLIIGIPAVAIIGDEVLKIIKEVKKKKDV
jgi:signal peptidase